MAIKWKYEVYEKSSDGTLGDIEVFSSKSKAWDRVWDLTREMPQGSKAVFQPRVYKVNGRIIER
jgi:hypothetical protein